MRRSRRQSHTFLRGVAAVVGLALLPSPAWALRSAAIPQRDAGLEELAQAIRTDEVTLQDSSGQPIILRVTRPSAPSAQPVVLFFPGYPDHVDNPLYAQLLAPFARGGYPTILVDAGQTGSGELPFDPARYLDNMVAVVRSVWQNRDLQLPLDHGLIVGGYSFGGFGARQMAVLVSQHDPRLTGISLRAVASFSGAMDLAGTFRTRRARRPEATDIG